VQLVKEIKMKSLQSVWVMFHCATHLQHCKYTICKAKCKITAVKYCVLQALKEKPYNVRQHKKQKLNDHNSTRSRS